jgi:hypothetical protein
MEFLMCLLTRYVVLPGLLLPALAGAFTSISLSPGWNLVGNSDEAAIDVTSKLSGSQITTVWKWDKVNSRWAFYTPTMTSAVLDTYAASKGYDVLSTIDSKDGFWVNAGAAVTISDPLSPPPTTGTGTTLTATDLAPNWNLVASADKKTPSQLNTGLASSLTAASKSISTLWAWDAPSSSWRFYAPSLEANGQLSSYITSKSYLPFTNVLAVTDGYWVNIGGVVTPVVTPPAVGASLHALTFTSAADWYMRVTTSTIAQNTAAADGTYRYSELRTARAGGGTAYSWGPGSSPERGADLHWNGSSWTSCPINFENTQSVRDANGNSTYNYCNSTVIGTSNRSAPADISGRAMIDVYNEAATAATSNLAITSAATALGAATFPTGSSLYYTTDTPTTQAIAYYPGSGNSVWRYSAAVAAGGVSAQQAAGTACNSAETNTKGAIHSATLEQMMAATVGTPCINTPRTFVYNGTTYSSIISDDGWYQSTLSIGTVGPNGSATLAPVNTGATAPGYFSGNSIIAIAFTGTGINPVTYYSCQQRFTDSSRRNCTVIGSGSYTVSNMGDGRALSLNNVPSLATALTYERVFVERAGMVYYGYQSKPTASKTARLNLTGLNALFSKLGLPAVNPDAPVALTLGSYAGTYSSTFTGTDSGTVTSSISPSGVTTCSGVSASAVAFGCNFSVTPTGTDGTTAAISLGISGTGAVFTGTANYYTGDVSGAWSNTGGAGGTFTGSRQ